MADINNLIRITIVNAKKSTMNVQVDPWASSYILQENENLQLAFGIDNAIPSFDIADHGDLRILTVWNCEDYFVQVENELVLWTSFASNVPD